MRGYRCTFFTWFWKWYHPNGGFLLWYIFAICIWILHLLTAISLIGKVAVLLLQFLGIEKPSDHRWFMVNISKHYLQMAPRKTLQGARLSDHEGHKYKKIIINKFAELFSRISRKKTVLSKYKYYCSELILYSYTKNNQEKTQV